jgi:hypothetical protein
MKRTAQVLLIAIMMLCLAVAPGCDVDIDWKDVAKKAVAEWVGSAVITAVDKYSGEATEKLVVDWVMDKAGDVAFLEPYLGYVNLRPMVESAWDLVWTNIYEVARDRGLDIDGEGPLIFSYDITPADFDERYIEGGLVDNLANMIE